MRVLVDADSCPVKAEIIILAAKYEVSVILIMSTAHYNLQETGSVEVVIVESSYQAVDMAIVNRIKSGDIIITQDYGLSALVLSKKGKPISPRGKIFTEKNIDLALSQRHINEKIRRGGGRVKGPKSFTQEDRERFKYNFEVLLQSSKN